MNLRDLLDLPVFTPSRQADSVHNTPAIISVITAEEIANLGVDNVWDLLNTVPGVEVTETSGGYYTVIIRGVIPGETNNTVLLLLNGHPMREFENGAFYLEAVPLPSIKQIEIVRGPGSVEYGTNGFSGVINVITKDGSDANANQAYAQFGHFQTLNAGASAGVKEGEFSAFLAIQHRGGDGYHENITDVHGQVTPLRNQNNYDNAYLKLSWHDFELSGNYFQDVKTDNGLNLNFFSPHGVNYRQGSFVELRYKHAVSDTVTVFGTAGYDLQTKRTDFSIYPWPPQVSPGVDQVGAGPAPVAPDYTYNGNRLSAEARADWTPFNWAKFSGGARFELNNHYPPPTDPIPSIPFERESDASVYAEASLNPTEQLGLSAGVRYDHNSRFGGVAVPRAGMVYSLTKDVSVKVLYGRAYRIPTFNERYWAFWGGDFPQVDPNTSAPVSAAYVLKPETIDTGDVGVDWKIGRHALRVNGFYLHISDLISLTQSGTFYNPVIQGPDNEIRYGNSSGYSVAGAEAEIRGYPTEWLFYYANVSTKYAYQGATSNKLGFRSPVLANVGITYTFPGTLRKLRLNTNAILTGQRGGPLISDRDTSAFPQSTLSESAYVVWNANLKYTLPGGVELSALAFNLLNTQYRYPDFFRYAGPEVPGSPFELFFKVAIQF